jgi:TetR/AcrR family transcriptional regulator, transcriptional repressor for nem operon
VARHREFDEGAAVAVARDVFWEHGYASTSLAHLQAATGLSKSTLYQTFASKRGLFDRAVQDYLEAVVDPLLRPLEADGAGRAELAAYFEALERSFRTAPDQVARRGCLLLNTATELADLDGAAADLVRAYRLRVRAAFGKVLESTGQPVADPQGRADILTAAQIGLMVTCRLDPALAAALAETLAAEVRSW